MRPYFPGPCLRRSHTTEAGQQWPLLDNVDLICHIIHVTLHTEQYANLRVLKDFFFLKANNDNGLPQILKPEKH